MTCRHVQRALEAYLDEELTVLEALAIDDHLGECARCRQAMEAAATLHCLFAADVMQDEPPPGLRSRILGRVHAEARMGELAIRGPRRWALHAAFVAVAVVVVALVALAPTQGPAGPLRAGEVMREHAQFEAFSLPAEAVPVDSAARAERWLEDRLRVPLVLPGAAGRGEPLAAMRIATIADRQAAHLLYERDGRRVSLFVIPHRLSPPSESNEEEILGVDVYSGRAGDLRVSWWGHQGDLYLAAAQPDDTDLRALARLCIHGRRG
jgi:anti-sigma factor RsiW